MIKDNIPKPLSWGYTLSDSLKWYREAVKNIKSSQDGLRLRAGIAAVPIMLEVLKYNAGILKGVIEWGKAGKIPDTLSIAAFEQALRQTEKAIAKAEGIE